MPKSQPTNKEIYDALLQLATQFYSYKEKTEDKISKLDKIDEMEKNIAWLVGEHTDDIEKLKTRVDRVEDKLQLPKMQFTF